MLPPNRRIASESLLGSYRRWGGGSPLRSVRRWGEEGGGRARYRLRESVRKLQKVGGGGGGGSPLRSVRRWGEEGGRGIASESLLGSYRRWGRGVATTTHKEGPQLVE